MLESRAWRELTLARKALQRLDHERPHDTLWFASLRILILSKERPIMGTRHSGPLSVFLDFHVVQDPDCAITHRSGLAAYRESLIHGQFVGRSWNGSGYTNREAE